MYLIFVLTSWVNIFRFYRTSKFFVICKTLFFIVLSEILSTKNLYKVQFNVRPNSQSEYPKLYFPLGFSTEYLCSHIPFS